MEGKGKGATPGERAALIDRLAEKARMARVETIRQISLAKRGH